MITMLHIPFRVVRGCGEGSVLMQGWRPDPDDLLWIVQKQVVSGSEARELGPPLQQREPQERTLRALMLATGACALTTFVAYWLLHVFDLSNVVMLFLLTAVLVALKLGRVAGVWAALLCVGCLDFFFVEPKLSFAVSDTQYVFTLVLLLAAALVTSELAARLRSEARAAQNTLLRMEGERLRNAVLAAVSHDLKTPLTAIRGLAEMLERSTDLARSEGTDLARSIRLQAEELQRLVTNLLDLARMQSEGVRLNKQWHPLAEIVGTSLARSATLLAQRQIRAELPADLPLLEVDGILFERVLVNLLENAGKYTPPNATVSIRATAIGDSIQILIEDDGPGLPAPDLECLFAPFTRGQKESSISGVGLGLTLCRSIVTAHGGTIRARQVPHGASFEIRVPIAESPEVESERVP
jgi:K+-sensing histidine kinase KdpD